jgi:Tfp pilus assembly protein PilV
VCSRRATPRRATPRASRGFSYAEILLSVVLIGVLLVPAMQALQAAMLGTPSEAATPGSLLLQSKMEEVLAAPYSRLYGETYVAGGNTATSISAVFSDPAGTAQRRVVTVYRYDPSLRALSTSDTGVALVSVYYEAEGAARGLTTLKGRWW